MKRQTRKGQALIVAAGNTVVRGLGFLMRLTVARLLGPEAVGVMELANSAHMLAVTPASAGLPGAVSRLTARAEEAERGRILRAGKRLAGRLGAVIALFFFLFSSGIARLLGDERTLPALWMMAPSVVLIGLSSVYDGYFYGSGNAWPPVLSELGEQLLRFLAAVSLLLGLSGLSLPWRAALPALAATLGEGAGLWIVRAMAGRGRGRSRERADPGLQGKLIRLSLPLMLNRLSHTGLRALCGVIIPLRLTAGGFGQGEALSRMGMLNGMVMPLMFLPGLATGALAAVGGPAMAQCRTARQQRRVALRFMGPALALGGMGSLILYGAAPLIARYVYRLPELSPLIRALCPMAALLALQQTAGGMMTGLGLQKKALSAALLGSAATLLCTWQWTARPGLHIYGAGYAAMTGHGLCLTASLISLALGVTGRRREKQTAEAGM